MGEAFIINIFDLHFTPTKVCLLSAAMAITRSLLPSSVTLLMLLLLLSSTSNAVPMSRSLNLMDEGSFGHMKDLRNIHSENVKESWEITERVTERLNLELNDYPGSGANNRHTPRP
ncbi:hypothetical protein HanPI659440_Chr05g0210241 [Helianthus annuus]|nr:hypothetical protein HanHA300_Chr05g0189251 [Helianthus annuus]KAJ0578185.1 hypothetical protein HanIR_Chr05g0244511 [Helianthus annuus]KAJ0748269.1 hypothetical protein HanOQP8_Chr05g0199331 [Helianthus annuus]KAJ0790022.1 hypothetical protein HanPI659440_Chr05g0210241 [Helianthus annuus]